MWLWQQFLLVSLSSLKNPFPLTIRSTGGFTSNCLMSSNVFWCLSVQTKRACFFVSSLIGINSCRKFLQKVDKKLTILQKVRHSFKERSIFDVFDIDLISCINLSAPSTPPTSKSHSIYKVDFNSKSLNYMKIRFKGLIYFELQQSLN